MRRRILALLSLIVCVVCLSLTACDKVTPQEQAEQVVAAKEESVTSYSSFSAGEETDPLVQSREGNADMYLIAHAESGDKMVYVYQDIAYDTDSKYRYVDVYMPTAKEKLDPKTPVFLYLHGGGWLAGSRKDEQKSLMPYIASTGVVVVSMEYGLWFGLNQMDFAPKGVYGWQSLKIMDILNIVLKNEHPVSVNDMMADITACIKFLRDAYLPSLGLVAANIGIGGYSAGGHLSSLYAYKYHDQSPMPIAFLMDLVGPVKLLDETYLRVLEQFTGQVSATGEDADLAEAANGVVSIIRPLLQDLAGPLAGILGEENPIDISTDEGYHHALESIAQFQPIDYLDSNSVPTIICYARQHDKIPAAEALFKDVEFDDFIPITVYRSISAKLDETGIVHEDKMFDELTHNSIGKDMSSCRWMATRVAAYCELYCRYGDAATE